MCQGSGSQSREKVAYNYEFPKKSKAKQLVRDIVGHKLKIVTLRA